MPVQEVAENRRDELAADIGKNMLAFKEVAEKEKCAHVQGVSQECHAEIPCKCQICFLLESKKVRVEFQAFPICC